MTIVLMITAAAIFGMAAVALLFAVTRGAAEVGALRATAIDQLWKRYNLTSDLITWAIHDGGPDATDRLHRVTAARDEIMKNRANESARLAAEDKLQAALNAFYRAAETDPELISSHEIVMIVAHLNLADAGIAEKVDAFNTAAAAFNVRVGGGLSGLLARAAGISPVPQIMLTAAPERSAQPAKLFASIAPESPGESA